MSSTAVQHRGAVSADSIVDTALRIIDAHGIDGLTMRRLGHELGVDPMTVYRHFPNKGAVLDGVMERIWASVDVAGSADGGSWQNQLAAIMHSLRAALLAHPRAISIIGTRPAAGAVVFLLMEQIVGALVAAGMELRDTSADLLNAVVNYTVGHVLAEAGDPVGGDADRHADPMISPIHFPNLAAVFSSGWQYNPYRQYDRALRSMIEGWS
ncbi:TetR/AcrR family transcriptional regulator C-terminal domain-containing protein [Tessaracoccus caeni]|uniref:TetR/AcrR family transcriptional regulator C-terminal domain-containing protein n=1 Tax=Tessaracoccus caeni TaxID=3031239 RepID=UPI0023DA1571|nr:TetR/AcrR family transcriptional regulator C-terminal domain-containing protein [Tessaracoccus caeni]MDF1489718.1 TetR/AcrR family transcriptional regulator C-terminal domain-containing protein [Tessaracoccus caeni]